MCWVGNGFAGLFGVSLKLKQQASEPLAGRILVQPGVPENVDGDFWQVGGWLTQARPERRTQEKPSLELRQQPDGQVQMAAFLPLAVQAVIFSTCVWRVYRKSMTALR